MCDQNYFGSRLVYLLNLVLIQNIFGLIFVTDSGISELKIKALEEETAPNVHIALCPSRRPYQQHLVIFKIESDLMGSVEPTAGLHNAGHNVESLGSLRDQSRLPPCLRVPLSFWQTSRARCVSPNICTTLEAKEHVANAAELCSIGPVAVTTIMHCSVLFFQIHRGAPGIHFT